MIGAVIGGWLGHLLAKHGWGALVAGGLIGAFGGTTLPIGGVWLLSLFQDRRVQAESEVERLRGELAASRTEVVDRDAEIKQLRATELAPVHTEAIKNTLRSVQEQVASNHVVEFVSAGERDSLVGHVPSSVPLIDNWNGNAALDSYLGQRLQEQSETEIARFDHHIYSHDALRRIFDFALGRAMSSDAAVPYQIPWAPPNDLAPDEVRILNGQNPAIFAARANNQITREQTMEVMQRFLNEVLSWDDVIKYADTSRIAALADSRAFLVAELGTQLEKHGYLLGSGCARCAGT